MGLLIQKQPPEVFCKKRPQTFFKKSLWHRCFPVNSVKFLRTRFLQNPSGQLLLLIVRNDYRIIYIKVFENRAKTSVPFISTYNSL